ncbi:MAG TPA: nitrilase-related carbon-nitrogen hydrolase [Blastocatellia bacterium]|nr:nitrilase-related carbon-nitrogen hydrolase [Blastocatellia bacterium]
MLVAVVQMKITDGSPATNFDHAHTLINSSPGANLYLLPELWTTGYAHSSWQDTAVNVTPKIYADLQEFSKSINAWIGGSMISVNDEEQLVNRFWLFSPTGEPPIHYDKAHLFAPMLEDKYLASGTRRVQVTLGGIKASPSICFDLRFPEMYRKAALEGAELFLVSSEWPQPRCETLRLLARARAAENQAYLLLSNRLGPAKDGTTFCGESMIVGPDGSIISDAKDQEVVITADLDPLHIPELRSKFQVLTLTVNGVDS